MPILFLIIMKRLIYSLQFSGAQMNLQKYQRMKLTLHQKELRIFSEKEFTKITLTRLKNLLQYLILRIH